MVNGQLAGTCGQGHATLITIIWSIFYGTNKHHEMTGSYLRQGNGRMCSCIKMPWINPCVIYLKKCINKSLYWSSPLQLTFLIWIDFVYLIVSSLITLQKPIALIHFNCLFTLIVEPNVVIDCCFTGKLNLNISHSNWFS